MNRSILIAISVFLLLSIYMLTGLVGCGKSEAQATAEVSAPLKTMMTVSVRELDSIRIPREVVVTGKTSPSRMVMLKAETPGAISFVAEERGKLLREGQLIAEIDLDDRPQRLKQAQATLEQAQLEYEATLRLEERELRSPAQVAQSLSQLRGAEQQVEVIELDMEKTRLVSPFDAMLHERQVEVGDYVGVGDPVAHLIDLDPLVITGEITEFQVGKVHIGESGRAELASGEEVEGRIRYVSGEADPQSRTFTVELEVSNPNMSLPAGVTSTIYIETEMVDAYSISPGLISISDDGRAGVKIVNSDDEVEFIEADIVRTTPQTLWITGLPKSIRLITRGQGFVQSGEVVEVVLDTSGKD